LVHPVVFFPSILFDGDELGNFVTLPKFTGVGLFGTNGTGAFGQESIKIEDGQKSYILGHASNITGGSSASLELENTNADYQTTASAKIIVIVAGSNTTVTDFEIIEDSSADAGSGTQLEDFPSVSLGASTRITSKTLTVAASKYITIKSNTGTISDVIAILVE